MIGALFPFPPYHAASSKHSQTYPMRKKGGRSLPFSKRFPARSHAPPPSDPCPPRYARSRLLVASASENSRTSTLMLCLMGFQLPFFTSATSAIGMYVSMNSGNVNM